MILILEIFFIAFIGYLIGRAGDYFAGHWDFFHHWIYGVVCIVFGIFLDPAFIYFGIGLIISDLKDMMQLKIFGPDKKDKIRFWDID